MSEVVFESYDHLYTKAMTEYEAGRIILGDVIDFYADLIEQEQLSELDLGRTNMLH